MKLNHLRPLGLSVVALLATAPAALALDANDFAHKLIGVYAQSLPSAASISFGPATVAGNTITYDGITVTAPGTVDGPAKIDTKLIFTGVTEQPDGSYLADALSLPDIDSKFEGGEVTISNIAFKHLYVANGTSPGPVDSSRLFGDLSLGPVALKVDGATAFTIDTVTVNNSFKPAQVGDLAEIDSTGLTSGMKFDMSGVKDEAALAQAKALDLVTVTGKAIETGTWSLKDGHLNLSEMSLDLDKVGKVKFAFDLTGYTPQFLQNLNAVLQTVGGQDTTAEKQQQQTAMLLASAGTLFINSASLRYDDASITGRVLDFVAKQQGMTKAALIDQVVATMPEMDESGSDPTPPEVMKTMQAATRAFLNDPHSIEIKLAPPAPLGVLGIVAAAMQPQSLVDQIGLKVLVNDKEITAADAARETGVAPATTDGSAATPADDGDQSAAPAGDDSEGAATDDSGDDASSTDRLKAHHD